MNLTYRFLNSSAGRFLTGWILAHMSIFIPAKHLRETDSLLAFQAPRPSYPFHVLLVPKKNLHSFAELQPSDPFLADLVTTVQSIVAEYYLNAYRLIVNGGKYQEFPHLHFHLISKVELPTYSAMVSDHTAL
jgi:histidine triad (HIT) family protein